MTQKTDFPTLPEILLPSAQLFVSVLIVKPELFVVLFSPDSAALDAVEAVVIKLED